MRADIKTDTPRHAERNVMQWQIQSETETLVVHACAHTAGLARSVLIRLFPIYLLVDAIQNYCWLNYNQTLSTITVAISFSEYNSGQILKLESYIFLMMYSLSKYNIKSDSNFELYIKKKLFGSARFTQVTQTDVKKAGGAEKRAVCTPVNGIVVIKQIAIRSEKTHQVARFKQPHTHTHTY